MIDLQEKGFELIQEAIASNDKLAAAQITTVGKEFLIVPNTRWLKTFNQWIEEKHPEIITQLQEEAYSQEDSWVDYLTNRKWGYENRCCSCLRKRV